MEKAGGIGLVKSNAITLKNAPDLRKGTRINLRELTSDFRFEASAYGIYARQAQDQLRASGYKTESLKAGGKLCIDADKAFQFARTYVKPAFGVPFMGSADVIFLDFRPRKFLSRTNTKKLGSLMIRPWDVLLTRSGTIGNVAIAPPDWTSYALSEDVMRLRFEDPTFAGFVACFLRSRWGRAQTVGSSYGSVISHIEPQHLERVLVPMVPPATIITVGKAFCEAANDRAEANALLRKAESIFATVFNLPSSPVAVESHFSRVRLSELDGRFDGNYHSPKPRTVLDALIAHGASLTTVKDFAGDGAVRAVTKFRERVYSRVGIPFNSSKELFQIDPIGMDKLAPNLHSDDMSEIGLKRGMIGVTCSGTLGRVMHIPGYMEGWAGSQDFNRIVTSSIEDSAFLSAWLGSPYGQVLLMRYGYGSVIRHIDKGMLESMPVPILASAQKREISDLALKCLELRERAWESEQRALSVLETSLARI